MSHNYLKGRDGDRANAILAATGYNFALLLRWLMGLLRAFSGPLAPTDLLPIPLKLAAQWFFTDD